MKKTINDIGERKLIKTIIKDKFFKNLDLDDCGILNIGDETLLVSTDQMFEKPMLLDVGGTYEDLGHFFVTQNVSDIAAMGGSPIAFLSSITLPNNFSLSDLELLLSGIKMGLSDYNINLLGGDTKEGHAFKLSGTIIGKGNKNILKRKGCNIGELVCISGKLGTIFSNYIDYANKKTNFLYRPRAKTELGRVLSSINDCTSCIDLSDGLLAGLDTLAELNNLSFKIKINEIDIDIPNININYKTWLNYVLNIGGDYELLFTMKDTKQSRSIISQQNILVIGKTVLKDKQNIILDDDKNIEINYWEHFKNLNDSNLSIKRFIG